MQIIVYHSKARKTMCGMGTFCLIGMISLQLTIQNGNLKIKFLDVTCQKGKTETDELNAYDNIVTGMASISNNDYIIGYILINERLIINSTTAHTVRVYYINVPKG